MVDKVRGANPIWLLDDLVGNLLDDNYWIFYLENEIPYIPATVYHDPQGNVPWNNPIQFLANGTLPNDIYFDPDVVYRLEIRRGQTQSDPLIYLIENYVPGTSGDSPITAVALPTDNQITNAQFSIISFPDTFTLTNATNPDPIPFAPGWELVLAGTGNVTLTREPLNDTSPNPTNAPYALRITLSGTWTADNCFLRQRFTQNGMLWANKTVASSITARIESSSVGNLISASLVDSNGTTLAEILDPVGLNTTYTVYPDYDTLGDTTNPDVPPAAYIDYLLKIPSNVDMYVTSFQLIAQDLQTSLPYEQDSIDRQQDYTFHNYRESAVIQPKASILTGWNFRLNPWQFTPTASTNIALAAQYVTDQTIVVSENAGTLDSARTVEGYFSLEQVESASAGRFAIIQYIDMRTIAPYWGSVVSSLVNAGISTIHGTGLQMKMRLIYRASSPVVSVPGTLDNPISSWATTDPTFTAGWTALPPRIDNVYTIDSATLEPMPFEGFDLPVPFSADAMLGIVLYSVNTLNSAASADSIYFDRISLVPNEFAVESNPQTYDQVLRECDFYYEKSYAQDVLPGTANAGGCLFAYQTPRINGGSTEVQITAFGFQFRENARTDNPNITLYSPITANAPDFVYGQTRTSTNTGAIDIDVVNWTETQKSATGVSFISNNVASGFAPAVGTSFQNAWIFYHYTKDARLGLWD